VGTLQYALELPAEIVWVHVSLAAVTWVAILWAAAVAGHPSPRPASGRADRLVVETASS
jgi:heme a synthase